MGEAGRGRVGGVHGGGKAGRTDDGGQVLDRGGLLNLGHHFGRVPGCIEQLPQPEDVGVALDETERDPIEVDVIEAELQVGRVFVRHGGARDEGVRQVEALSTRELGVIQDFTLHPPFALLFDHHSQFAVIEQDAVPDLQCIQHNRMRQRDPGGVARLVDRRVETEVLPLDQLDRSAGVRIWEEPHPVLRP